VRAEIARKQKDAEFKLARSAAAAASPAPRAGAREGAGSPAASLASAMSEGTTGYMDVGDAGAAAGAAEASELSRVRTQLAEQDGKWRTAYEKVIHHDIMTHETRPTHDSREQTDTTLTPARLSYLCLCLCLCLGSFLPLFALDLLTR
jgi:hypothetical protein